MSNGSKATSRTTRKTRNAASARTPLSPNGRPSRSSRADTQPFVLALAASERKNVLMLRRALIAAVLLLASAAHAQTAPKGWTVEATPNAWVATSPEKVTLAFYPPEKNSNPFVFWFEQAGLRRTFHYGSKIVQQDEPRPTTDPDAGPLIAQGRTIEASGTRTSVLSYGWQTPKGKQLAQIIFPSGVKPDSPAYTAALDEINRAWKAKLAYTPGG
jgi:hypothetical protein